MATTATKKKEPQAYTVQQGDIREQPGDVCADRKNRSTGTHIIIVQDDAFWTVGCADHGYMTSQLDKWGRACDVARMPRDWCPECKDAPAPQPKVRESKGGVAPKDQTPEQRAEYQQQAVAKAAADRLAKLEAEQEAARLELEGMAARIAESDAEAGKLRDAEASAFAKLDKAKPGTERHTELEAEWKRAARAADGAAANLMGLLARKRALSQKLNEVAA